MKLTTIACLLAVVAVVVVVQFRHQADAACVFQCAEMAYYATEQGIIGQSEPESRYWRGPALNGTSLYYQEIYAETYSTLLAGPFAKPSFGKDKAVEQESIHRIDFVMGNDRIKVEGSILAVEDGRANRHKTIFSLDDGGASSLFYRSGRPVKLVRRCYDISIRNRFELRVLLWVTRPELSKYASLTNHFRGMDELKELVEISN